MNRAIKKTGYVVNQHARSLVTQRSESVAFILSEPHERLFADPNFAVLLRGCTQALAEHDIGLFVCIAASRSERDQDHPLPRGRATWTARCWCPRTPATRCSTCSARRACPYVACGAPLGLRVEGRLRGGRRPRRRAHHGRVPAVGRAGPRIATITGPLDTSGGRGRLEGYRDVVGGSFDESLIEEGDYTQDSGERAMTKLLERRPDLDAVFVASDVMALGALNALRRAGRRVPEDVAIGGFDDSSAAVAARPALTTIRQPYQRISSEMVRLLLAAIDGERAVGGDPADRAGAARKARESTTCETGRLAADFPRTRLSRLGPGRYRWRLPGRARNRVQHGRAEPVASP